MHFYWNRFTILLLLMLSIGSASAQTGIPDTNTVIQNFDSMAATLTLPANWRMFPSSASPVWSTGAAVVTQQASSGSPTAGGTYNFGSNAAERAVGAMTSAGFASPNSLMGYFRNTNSAPLESVSVSYAAERYRRNTAAASIQFYYSTDGSAWTAVTAGDVAAASFPIGTSAYFYAPPLIVSVSAFTVTFPSPIAVNGDFYLRWNINTTGSNSQGITIDDINVTGTFTAAPATTVSSVNVIDTNNVDITFSAAMGASVSTAANYTLSGSGQGTLAATPTSVTPQGGNTYRLTWATGEMTIGGDITISTSGLLDNLGNALGTPTSATDAGAGVGTAPTISSTTRNVGSNNPTNAASVIFDATFSEPMTGLTDTNLSLLTSGVTGAAITGVAGGPTVWTVTVSTGTGNGTIQLDLSNTTGLSDLAGNAVSNTPFSGTEAFSIDKAAPGITLSSGVGLLTNAAFSVTVLTGESTADFAGGDVTITNGLISDFSGSGVNYSFIVTPTANGVVSVSVNGSTFTDAAGNANSASNTITTDYDGTQPTATLTTTAPDPTGVSPIPFRVQFSEAMTGFALGDISVTSGTAGGFTPVNSSTFDFTVTPSATVATVVVNVAAGVATDPATNPNQAATALSVDYDGTPPQVEAAFTAQSTNTLTITFDATMGAGVLTPGNYVLTGMTPGSVAASPTSVVLVSGSTYLLTWGSGEFEEDNVVLTLSNVFDAKGTALDPAHSAVSGTVPVEASAFAIE